MNALAPALAFAACAALVAMAGVMLCRSVDRLAQAYGWGRGWVGLALLAVVTSMPELAAGLSASAWVQAPDLAVGHALGACVVNLAFLVVVDLLQPQQPMYLHASPSHLLSAGFGVVMLGLVTLSLVAGRQVPELLHVGTYSPALLGLYLLALRSLFRHQSSGGAAPAAVPLPQPATAPAHHPVSGDAQALPPSQTTRRDWRRFGLAAAAVMAAGAWLPDLAARLAAAAGLSQSFIGAVFMATVTALPEMAVTVSALRMGALDMALGNLLGSNLFNVAILAVDDVAYTRGPLLAHASPQHAGTAATALVMCGLVIVGLVMRPRGRLLRRASWISVGLVAAYAIHAGLQALVRP
jgi:cation:H+ antiporter